MSDPVESAVEGVEQELHTQRVEHAAEEAEHAAEHAEQAVHETADELREAVEQASENAEDAAAAATAAALSAATQPDTVDYERIGRMIDESLDRRLATPVENEPDESADDVDIDEPPEHSSFLYKRRT